MEGCSLILNKKKTVYIERLMNSYILRTRKNIHALHSDFFSQIAEALETLEARTESKQETWTR